MSLFEKFKPSDRPKKEDEYKTDKQLTQEEIIYSVFTDEKGYSRPMNEHPRFKEVVDKLHELDRLYNNVSEAKKNLMNQVAKKRFGFLIAGLSGIVVMTELLTRAVNDVPLIISLLTMVLGVFTGGHSMEKENDAKSKHRVALRQRVAFIAEDELKNKKDQEETKSE
ncbi:hypothetical protein A3B93_01970 [Candidatus Nomurabacteria bacterium RIFCSPHIGHO2_02_FULL_42_24]|uniref:Uncharacterized protein n=1 Tax=Candidatus Nomurabacteria bacterium RIFCSPHIGHO2_02_FULL_42_24 TaxID=1801757 RepID=A0A1F6WIZ1_9BACT|nr:MAG: hypothetical protein A3B93_01970 [Candidatus Nomurabacteria bacterium RIFCSPHIGHO2_02_FULL_42_24]